MTVGKVPRGLNSGFGITAFSRCSSLRDWDSNLLWKSRSTVRGRAWASFKVVCSAFYLPFVGVFSKASAAAIAPFGRWALIGVSARGRLLETAQFLGVRSVSASRRSMISISKQLALYSRSYSKHLQHNWQGSLSTTLPFKEPMVHVPYGDYNSKICPPQFCGVLKVRGFALAHVCGSLLELHPDSPTWPK